MSYDMNIGEESFNYTYNVSPMWYKAKPDKGIRTHYEMTGRDAVEPLTDIYCYMIDNYDDLVKLDPSNGWGDYEGALQFVGELILASLRNPHEIWDGD